MLQVIVSFEKDERNDWMALLSCGHTQHMRHNPPWTNRPWVEDPMRRDNYIGTEIDCLKCDMD